MNELPADLGYWLAPDWQTHDQCWLAWPFRPDSWGGLFEHACLAHAAIARAIAEFEPVTVVVRPGFEKEARLQLGRGIELAPLELDDSWLRDIGPGFLFNRDGGRAGVAFQFNGWGNRVHGYERDAEFARWLLDQLALPRHDCPLSLETGAIQVDSVGTLIALRSGILDAHRNPTVDQRLVEELLAMFLGVGKIIWLDDSPERDWPWRQTVDLVRFCGPAHVLCAEGYGPDDPLARRLDDIASQLAEAHDALGRSFRIDRVARATPARESSGLDSYLNFYLANGAVFVPSYGGETDEAAQAVIGQAFSGRSVVPVDAGVLRVRGMGCHSLTLPIPSAI